MNLKRVFLYNFTALVLSLLTVSAGFSVETEVTTTWQNEIGATWAHTQGFTGKGVEVAIVDTGLDAVDSAFQKRVVRKEITSELGHGKIRGVGAESHATHVCGIIGANSKDFKGVAPDCSMVVYDGYINESVLESVKNSNAKVVNLSLKAEDCSRFYKELLEIVASGKLLILAASNNAQDIDYNESLRNFRKLANNGSVIIVGNCYLKSEKDSSKSGMLNPNSSHPGDIYAYTSPYSFERAKEEQAKTGSIADNFITAPGTNILSTFPKGQMGYMTGCSQSAPMVTGAACLLWEKHPHFTAAQVKNVILESASPFTEFPATFNWVKDARMEHEKKIGSSVPYSSHFAEYYGRGELNIKAMFELAERK